jgi:hypothetical protein
MKEIIVYLNNEDLMDVHDFPGFEPLWKYIIQNSKHDPREWGRIKTEKLTLVFYSLSTIEDYICTQNAVNVTI